MITSQYRLLALVGHPVSHSLSPVFQNAALAHLALPYVYLAFNVLPEHLPAAVAGFRTLGIAGFNVTVPHKETVIPFLDGMAGCAQSLVAVNTVVNVRGELIGHNTDVAGLQTALQHNGYAPGEPVVLLGAGGAARAAVYCTAYLGNSPLTIYNRTRVRAESVSEWAKTILKREVQVDSWESLSSGGSTFLAECRWLINATSLGLGGEQLPVPWDQLKRCRAIIDLVYQPGETSLVREARRRGFVSCDGKSMLLGQGAESFFLFTGHKPPVEFMEQSLEASVFNIPPTGMNEPA